MIQDALASSRMSITEVPMSVSEEGQQRQAMPAMQPAMHMVTKCHKADAFWTFLCCENIKFQSFEMNWRRKPQVAGDPKLRRWV